MALSEISVSNCFEQADWCFQRAWYGNSWLTMRHTMRTGCSFHLLQDALQEALSSVQPRRHSSGCLSHDMLFDLFNSVRNCSIGHCRPMPVIGGLTVVPYPARSDIDPSKRSRITTTIAVCTWTFQQWRLLVMRAPLSLQVFHDFVPYTIGTLGKTYALLPWGHLSAALFTLRAQLVERTLAYLERHDLMDWVPLDSYVPISAHISWRSGYLTWRLLVFPIISPIAFISEYMDHRHLEPTLLEMRHRLMRISYPSCLYHRRFSLLQCGHTHPLLPVHVFRSTVNPTSVPPNLSGLTNEALAACLVTLSSYGCRPLPEVNWRLVYPHPPTFEKMQQWETAYLKSDLQTANTIIGLANL